MKEIGDELKTFFKEQGISQSEIARELGVAQSYINALFSGKRAFGKKQAQTFREKFGLSPVWLLTGEGSMLVTDDQSAPVQTVSGNGNTAVQGDGNQVNSETSRFLSLLEKKDEQISKKDEQIDRLLSLLELKSKSEK